MPYELGDTVSSHFDPSIVAGSYIASLTGCILTVELLHRRGTGLNNWRSWIDTLACATSLGLIGIWCMHFIGNRAIILGDGQPDIQLVYSAGFSVLSVVLPVIGLSIAFAVAEFPIRSYALQWVALCCTGVFAGLSIVGMHYMGNFGIYNYKLNYEERFLAASIIIAIGDSMTVLVLFYTWRDKWINDWRKRILCAVTLAAGVSAMHFTASTKCIYVLKSYSDADAIRSRNLQVIIAGALCGSAIAMVSGVLFATRQRAANRKKTSKKVMLSCVMFDPDGRILVTKDGVLPSREITDKFNSRSYTDDFDKSHPVFHWIFRVTRNWSCVSELIPMMRAHLSDLRANGDIWSSNSNAGASFEMESRFDYSIIFRERFCMAAASLASSMHLRVDKIGTLFDNIVDTGTLKDEPVIRRHTLPIKRSADMGMSTAMDGFGIGQLLFLTRRLNADDVDRLLNVGFKFGSVQQVGRNIAQYMQIPMTALEGHINALQNYNENLNTLQKNGTWLGCFAMIPKANSKGFDVAVKRSDQNQLPDVPLLSLEPSQWQARFLERMHGKTSMQCTLFLKDRDKRDVHRSDQEQRFAWTVLSAMTMLSDQMPPQWFQSARFYGKAVYAHYARPLRKPAIVTTLYSFVVCSDLHTTTELYPSITQTPLSFFSVRHQSYTGSPHYSILVQNIHREFGPLLARRPTSDADKAKKVSINMPNGSRTKLRKTPSQLEAASDDRSSKDSDSFEDQEVNTPSSARRNVISTASVPGNVGEKVWGGILVNSETVVESDKNSDKKDEKIDTTAEDIGLSGSTRIAIGTSALEKTFVDELCAFARANIPSKYGNPYANM